MNSRKLNSHLWLLVTLIVAIIAIIYSSAVVNADGDYSVNATVNVTAGGDGGGPGVGGGGGGGGGGGATEDARFTSLRDAIDDNGTLWGDVEALSLDNMLRLYLPIYTIARNRNNAFLSSIIITTIKEPNVPQEYMEIVGFAYRLGPAGATFNPPIILTIKYDPSLIPEGVSEENLFIAYWDETKLEWVKMDSILNTEENIITTNISQFSIYAVMAKTQPAEFLIADLSVTPSEVNIGESVSISVLVTNTGDLTGVYEVSIKIDNVVAQTKDLTLDGGDSETISFSVTLDSAGDYTLDVNGLSGKFAVKAPAPAPISEPTPAPEPTPALEPEPTPEPEVTTRVTIPKIQPTTGNGYNWGLIIAIYGTTMVVLGVLVYLLKRAK